LQGGDTYKEKRKKGSLMNAPSYNPENISRLQYRKEDHGGFLELRRQVAESGPMHLCLRFSLL
jgi:hypothetical protein